MRELEGTKISSSEAKEIDLELMDPDGYAFSVDQLMEIAGLSVAQVISECYPIMTSGKNSVLVCAGPGNNGGDGLVCARHLVQLGYNVKVYYPKEGNSGIFKILRKQLECQNIMMMNELDEDYLKRADIVVDAILGAGSSGELRGPFLDLVMKINKSCKNIISIDVPSGWDVDKGKIHPHSIETPSVIISIMLPKKFIDVERRGMISKNIKHFIAGRFLPLPIASMRNLKIPSYPNNKQFFQAEL